MAPSPLSRLLPTFIVVTLPVAHYSSAYGENADSTSAALAKAKQTYETAMEAVRKDVLGKIDKEILRRSGEGDLDGIEQLRNARLEFVSSGTWPQIGKIDECQRRAEKATKALDAALGKAQKDFTKAKDFDVARIVKDERQRLLQEDDIVPWGGNLAVHSGSPLRVVGSARLPLALTPFALRDYRLRIVAEHLEGDGPLGCSIPVPGKKRLEIKAQPEAQSEFVVLLSVRESLISAELGLVRPIPNILLDDTNPGKIEFWSDAGKFAIHSIQIKPIVASRPGEPAQGGQGDIDCRLMVNSKWHGKRWLGQNPSRLEGPRIVNAKITKKSDTQLELQTERWTGWGGSINWVLTVSGEQVRVDNIYFSGGQGIMEEVEGGGTLIGNVLQFASKSRYTGHDIVGRYDYNKLELEWVENPTTNEAGRRVCPTP
jgi:hypothetical protein